MPLTLTVIRWVHSWVVLVCRRGLWDTEEINSQLIFQLYFWPYCLSCRGCSIFLQWLTSSKAACSRRVLFPKPPSIEAQTMPYYRPVSPLAAAQSMPLDGMRVALRRKSKEWKIGTRNTHTSNGYFLRSMAHTTTTIDGLTLGRLPRLIHRKIWTDSRSTHDRC